MRKYLFILFSMVMISSCTKAQNSMAEAIDKLCAPLFPNGEPGAAVLVMKGNDIIFDKGYGIADIETKAKIDGNTFFNVASISKQFTATAAMQLCEKGIITLNDPVSKYFPNFKADFWKDITLGMLLSHCSGVPDARPRDNREFTLTCTDRESVQYMENLDFLHFTPGTQYEYMNPTFDLFYLMIENLTGMSFEQYMKENVFNPAGMKETLYFSPDKIIPNMAHCYDYESSSVSDEDNDKPQSATAASVNQTENKNKEWYEYDYGEETFFATKADGGIYSSTHEFVLWEKALRNNLVMSAQSRDNAQSIHTDVSGSTFSSYQNRPFTGYGYGWFIDNTPDSPKKIYHTGDNGGFKALVCRYPEQNIFIVIFANRPDWDRWKLLKDIESVMFAE